MLTASSFGLVQDCRTSGGARAQAAAQPGCACWCLWYDSSGQSCVCTACVLATAWYTYRPCCARYLASLQTGCRTGMPDCLRNSLCGGCCL